MNKNTKTNNNYLDSAILETKARTYFEANKPIHAKFRLGYWKNGHILEISKDFFILDELREGGMVVFFKELNDIQEYLEKDKARGNIV